MASPSAHVCMKIDKKTCHIAADEGLTPIANPEKNPSTPNDAARRYGLFPVCFWLWSTDCKGIGASFLDSVFCLIGASTSVTRLFE